MYIVDILSGNKKVGLLCMTVLECKEHRFEANPGAISEESQSCKSDCLCRTKVQIDYYIPTFKQEDKLPDRT